jgi:hypothetical protein
MMSEASAFGYDVERAHTDAAAWPDTPPQRGLRRGGKLANLTRRDGLRKGKSPQ